MKKILAFVATFGISPTIFYIIVFCVLCAIIGLSFGFCGGNNQPIAPVDQKVIEEINSKNTATRTAALEKAFEAADAPRKVSDAQRAEIKKEVERNVMQGQDVTAEDFRRLIEESKK